MHEKYETKLAVLNKDNETLKEKVETQRDNSALGAVDKQSKVKLEKKLKKFRMQ